MTERRDGGMGDDTISRQTAIDTLMEILDRPNHADFLYTDEICNALGAMPPAQPLFPQRHENDCISREEAIKALGEEPEVWSGEDEYAQGLNNQWHYDVNALKAVPPTQPEQLERCPIYGGVCGYPSDQCYECPRHSGAQPEQRWIPVTERLPEENEVVLTQARFRDDIKMAVSARIDYNYWTGWGTREVNVVAWMPLPEPWKEGETRWMM